MSDLISKQAVIGMLQRRAQHQREWGNPTNMEIAKELDAVRDDVKELPVDSEAQRLREALESIQQEIKLWNSPEAALNVIKTITDTALSPQKGETPK